MKKVNFIPASFAYQCRMRKRMRRGLALCSVFVVALLAWTGIEFKSLEKLNAAVASLSTDVATAQSIAARTNTLRARRDQLVRSVKLMENTEGVLRLSAVLQAIELATPADSAITNLQIVRVPPVEKSGAPKSGAKGRKNETEREQEPMGTLTVQLSGIAPADSHVARLASRLSQNPLFENVKISQGAFENEKIVGCAFTIQASIALDRRFVEEKMGSAQ